MSPEAARQRAALRLAFAATLALVWGAMAREPLPGLTAVLAAQILVGMPRPPRPGQAVVLVTVIAGTGGAAFAVAVVFADRLLLLTAALGLLFFLGFLMRERVAGRPSLPATMLLNATAVVPVLTVQADILGAGVLATLVTAAAQALLVVWALYAVFPAPQKAAAMGAPAGAVAATDMPVREYNGAARALAKVAIVLPAQLFYLAEPTALAFPALLGLVTFLSAQDPAAGRAQLMILLLGNLVGSIVAAAASVALEVGPPLPALTLMALLGSLGFAGWIVTAQPRPGGAVALSGLVTFLMLFGLAASPFSVDVPVLDRVADIGVLSLYTIGAAALLLPPPEPRSPAARWPLHRPSQPAAQRRKVQAGMRKRLGRSFQAEPRTDGPSEHDMSQKRSPERVEAGRRRWNRQPSDQGGPQPFACNGVNLVTRPTALAQTTGGDR
jgi:hypothetical protein